MGGSGERPAGVLRDPEFLKLWVGQTISKFGSGIGGAALEVTAVLSLGASPGQMGLLQAARFAPVVALGLFAGVWADRVKRRPVLIWTDLGRAALLALVPLAAAMGWLRLELLFLVAPLLGMLTIFFDVTYQSFVPVLVRRQRVMEANSRLATSDALAEVTTPGLAGVLVTLITGPMTILLDAFSFVASAVSVWLIRADERRPQTGAIEADGDEGAEGGETAQGVLAEIRQGLVLVASHPALRALAGFNATRAFFGNFIGALYTVYCLRELDLGPVLMGVTIGVGGASNLLGTLIVGRVTRRFGIGPTIMGAMTLGSVTGFLLPLASGPPVVAFWFLVAAQASDLIHPLYDVNVLTVRQAVAPPRALGRVNASMQVLEGALMPLGAIVGGALGGVIGVRETLWIAVLGGLASRLWLMFSPVPKMREVPEAPGAQAVEDQV